MPTMPRKIRTHVNSAYRTRSVQNSTSIKSGGTYDRGSDSKRNSNTEDTTSLRSDSIAPKSTTPTSVPSAPQLSRTTPANAWASGDSRRIFGLTEDIERSKINAERKREELKEEKGSSGGLPNRTSIEERGEREEEERCKEELAEAEQCKCPSKKEFFDCALKSKVDKNGDDIDTVSHSNEGVKTHKSPVADFNSGDKTSSEEASVAPAGGAGGSWASRLRAATAASEKKRDFSIPSPAVGSTPELEAPKITTAAERLQYCLKDLTFNGDIEKNELKGEERLNVDLVTGPIINIEDSAVETPEETTSADRGQMTEKEEEEVKEEGQHRDVGLDPSDEKQCSKVGASHTSSIEGGGSDSHLLLSLPPPLPPPQTQVSKVDGQALRICEEELKHQISSKDAATCDAQTVSSSVIFDVDYRRKGDNAESTDDENEEHSCSGEAVAETFTEGVADAKKKKKKKKKKKNKKANGVEAVAGESAQKGAAQLCPNSHADLNAVFYENTHRLPYYGQASAAIHPAPHLVAYGPPYGIGCTGSATVITHQHPTAPTPPMPPPYQDATGACACAPASMAGNGGVPASSASFLSSSKSILPPPYFAVATATTLAVNPVTPHTIEAETVNGEEALDEVKKKKKKKKKNKKKKKAAATSAAHTPAENENAADGGEGDGDDDDDDDDGTDSVCLRCDEKQHHGEEKGKQTTTSSRAGSSNSTAGSVLIHNNATTEEGQLNVYKNQTGFVATDDTVAASSIKRDLVSSKISVQTATATATALLGKKMPPTHAGVDNNNNNNNTNNKSFVSPSVSESTSEAAPRMSLYSSSLAHRPPPLIITSPPYTANNIYNIYINNNTNTANIANNNNNNNGRSTVPSNLPLYPSHRVPPSHLGGASGGSGSGTSPPGAAVGFPSSFPPSPLLFTETQPPNAGNSTSANNNNNNNNNHPSFFGAGGGNIHHQHHPAQAPLPSTNTNAFCGVGVSAGRFNRTTSDFGGSLSASSHSAAAPFNNNNNNTNTNPTSNSAVNHGRYPSIGNSGYIAARQSPLNSYASNQHQPRHNHSRNTTLTGSGGGGANGGPSPSLYSNFRFGSLTNIHDDLNTSIPVQYTGSPASANNNNNRGGGGGGFAPPPAHTPLTDAIGTSPPLQSLLPPMVSSPRTVVTASATAPMSQGQGGGGDGGVHARTTSQSHYRHDPYKTSRSSTGNLLAGASTGSLGNLFAPGGVTTVNTTLPSNNSHALI